MTDRPRKVIVLGSGALKIGEAGEFDYSGSQAIKALKEEGVRTVLVNPNIATIQTSDDMADSVYLLPVSPEMVEKVIRKERPDGILMGFGGQTALNCGLELARRCVLTTNGVRVLGTPIEAIRDTEDRETFARRLGEIGVATPRSRAETTVAGALDAAAAIGYPVMVRAAFALGGLGSGRCGSPEELESRVRQALAHSPQVLIEEDLYGWKEVEYEVVRDAQDNCITVCNMENIDPLGIHTGESIVVAPSQTLSNREYHMLREIALRVIRHFGVVGECNIQFALDPASEAYRVIEVNARLSRSSALASKATGYPLAYVAAKLALGYALTELQNAVTRVTSACFEPALDYVVVKIPRWDLKKFRNVSTQLGSAMKSVGEVMAIGRNFEEALQKAVRMLDIGAPGLCTDRFAGCADIAPELARPGPERIFALAEAFRRGMTAEEIHRLTFIDHWFLDGIAGVVQVERALRRYAGGPCPAEILREAKRTGFADRQIAGILGIDEGVLRKYRYNRGIRPYVKQIDTLAAEYPAKTNYLYMTYDAAEDDVAWGGGKNVLVIGSGAYRIGSSVEFDWCCVNASLALRRMGYGAVLVNFNPETVSTDYDVCDRLYFDEISVETVRDIYEREHCIGVIVAVGGQLPNTLALRLEQEGLRIIGTSPADIDRAEDRHKFSALLDRIGVDQPPWREVSSLAGAEEFADAIGYPVLIRPSYVLSGAAMGVATNAGELKTFLGKAAEVSPDHPVVVSKFLENAKEVEVDAVAIGGRIVASAVMEHVENAGVHSGDATLVLPPQRTYLETIRRVQKISAEIAAELNITGPFNVQYLARGTDVKVIECNLRASRSFPFVSKVCRRNFIDIAVRGMLGEQVEPLNGLFFGLSYVGVKAPQFSFTRLQGADPTIGVEMASTGEVGCLGEDFDEAFLKALLSVGFRFPLKSVLLSTGPLVDKVAFLESARLFRRMGVRLYATRGTAEFLAECGEEATPVHWPSESGSPNAAELIESREVDLVINIPKNYQESELSNDYYIRRKAVDFGIPLITNIQLANRLAEALAHKKLDDLTIKELQAY